MATEVIQDVEPLMPSGGYPADVLALADELPKLAGRLEGLLAPETAKTVSRLMRLTNSYFSHLIEGEFIEPAGLESRVRIEQRKELRLSASTHIQAQESLERALSHYRNATWDVLFHRDMLCRVHHRLFTGVAKNGLRLKDGRILVPGEMRDQAQQNVVVGNHSAPSWKSVDQLIRRMQQIYGQAPDPRSRLLSALAYHHRLAFVHPFEDGNGRLARMMTHLQLMKLGIGSPLWSISRGIARVQGEYFDCLRAADRLTRGALVESGQPTHAGLIEFVRFMLLICKGEINYMSEAMGVKTLRERLERIVRYEPRFVDAGVKQEAARALHLLLIQGEVARADFKVYLGLKERTAIEQLQALIKLDVVEAPSPKSRALYPSLPVWLSQLIFPDLFRRYG